MAEMTMVERVAKAIYEEDDVWSQAFPWPAMGSSNQSPDNYRRIARAAIGAMREPSNAMLLAAWNVWHPWGTNAPSPANRPDQWVQMVKEVKASQVAMIEAALNEEVAG